MQVIGTGITIVGSGWFYGKEDRAMRTFFRRLERFCQLKQNKLRKEYTQLRLDAIEAQKSGDVRKYLVLNARADRMLDQVIYS